MLAQLLAPAEEAASSIKDQAGKAATSSGGGSSGSKRSSSGPAVPASATAKGISSITGLPLLPSFAIACHAGFDPHDGLLRIDGLVASEDGRTLHRLQLSGGAGSPEEAETVGQEIGLKLRQFVLQHGWV